MVGFRSLHKAFHPSRGFYMSNGKVFTTVEHEQSLVAVYQEPNGDVIALDTRETQVWQFSHDEGEERLSKRCSTFSELFESGIWL